MVFTLPLQIESSLLLRVLLFSSDQIITAVRSDRRTLQIYDPFIGFPSEHHVRAEQTGGSFNHVSILRREKLFYPTWSRLCFVA